MRIGLIPLDERPVNTRYPRCLAEIAGVELAMPSVDILSDFRRPATSAALIEWLQTEAQHCDVFIVGCETLGYGGLIPSRTSHESVATITARLETIHQLRWQYPDLRIFGFNVITRIPHYNSAIEEPDYWEAYGERLHMLSHYLDRSSQGEAVDDKLYALRSQIPKAYVDDFLRRRLRNHAINLTMLGLTADGVFDLLVMSSDDTSVYGLSSNEKRGLAQWAARLDLGEKLLMYPGADEIGSILVARAINQSQQRSPRFQVDYAVPGGENITAAFEDAPVRITVERQIKAAGGVIEADGDILLMVNPPRSPEIGWPNPYSEAEKRDRLPHLQAAVARLEQWIANGKPAAVADVAHSNGADNLFVDLLRQKDLLLKLASYSAWNTAGNAIGTTVAQACLTGHSSHNRMAQQRFLAHRLVEDWLYMGHVRNEVANWLEIQTDQPEPTPEMIPPTTSWIEAQLQEAMMPLNTGFRIVPHSLRLPWKRTFEIDFDLEQA